MTYTYTCKECNAESDFILTPGTPAKTWGPPEDCYPGEGPECEGPDECLCGEKIDHDDVIAEASEFEECYDGGPDRNEDEDER